MFAKVIIDISHEKVDRPFEYRVPENLLSVLEVGMGVMVPFGRGDTLRQGYVIDLVETPEFPAEKLKSIHSLSKGDAQASEKLIALACWIRKTYGSTMIQALKCVLPAREKKKTPERKTIRRICSPEVLQSEYAAALRKHYVGKARLLEALLVLEEGESVPYELLRDKLHVSAATITSFAAQGVIAVDTQTAYRNPMKFGEQKKASKILSRKQQSIVDTVLSEYDRGKTGTYLLHGITGSGKTEVYMAMIEGVVARGRAAIVLIPEIALTYQTAMRFYHRFGDRVSVMNSTLSAGEKYDQCERAKNGDIDVIIGPRSALFTPFEKLGLIIIDEEHEHTYKSENVPKYHARECAEYLASLHGASVVLGSATPSLESYYRAKKGEYTLFELKERLTGNTLPDVSVVDLRQELREGNRSVLSRQLEEKIEERLAKGEQTILFLNRRGYAGFVSCRNCGTVMKCPHCAVSLSQHRGGMLQCHYCGFEIQQPKECPECQSPYLMGFKAGTEAVEQTLIKRFPTARILRMDADTTRTKDSYEKILSAFSEHRADILLGTQMIVKGHDFPSVTLVGVLAADMSLFAGDYRAGERTFQLLTQAAGRAGRGERAGEVVIQTYQPDHYSILHAAKQDYEGFYEEELFYRDLCHYPPVEHLLAVLLLAGEEEEGAKWAEYLAKIARKNTAQGQSVLGPAPASLSKLQDTYRFMIYIKGGDLQELVARKDELEAQFSYAREKYEQTGHGQLQVSVQFDLDPMNNY